MKNLIKIILILFLIFLGFFFAYPKLQLYLASQKSTINKEAVVFFVLDSTDLESLADALIEKNIIDDKKLFLAVGEYKEMSRSNIALGKYKLTSELSYSNLLNGFKKNRLGNGNGELEVKVTFNNCSGPNVEKDMSKGR